MQLLRDEYRIKRITKVSADTLGSWRRSSTTSTPRRAGTIKAYNAAVKQDVPFNPNVKDGRRTVGLAVNEIQLGHYHR